MLGPETAHSPNADDLTTVYWAMLIVAALIAIAINVALVAFVVRYRAARGRTPRRLQGRRRGQLVASGVLALVAAAIFTLGVVFTDSASEVEASGPDGLAASSSRTAQVGIGLPAGEEDPLRIRAVGQQWLWRYEYPAAGGDGSEEASVDAGPGFADVFSYYELVVPVDTAVVVEVDSTDVVHRWWVPGLGAKVDAVPGTANLTWFKADEEGTYEGASYAFSGASYAAMRTKVTVVSATEYQQWLEEQALGIEAAQEIVQEQLSAGGPVEAEVEGEQP